MFKPQVLTLEEVLAEKEKYRAENSTNNEWWLDWKGEYFGFEFIYQYVKLECGWVQAPEMVCEHCVSMLVTKYGTEAERKQYNELMNLPTLHKAWITNKEYETERKRRRRGIQRRKKVLAKRSEKFKNSQFTV